MSKRVRITLLIICVITFVLSAVYIIINQTGINIGEEKKIQFEKTYQYQNKEGFVVEYIFYEDGRMSQKINCHGTKSELNTQEGYLEYIGNKGYSKCNIHGDKLKTLKIINDNELIVYIYDRAQGHCKIVEKINVKLKNENKKDNV